VNPPSSCQHSFTNRYGEEWLFCFDTDTNVATVKGSDVDWESYPVIEGVAYGLVMSADEKEWLARVWEENCSSVAVLGLYGGLPTELVVGKNHSFLSNQYCPICLLQKKEFEVHHCIWARDGGPNTPSNLLAICNSCHAIVTRGSVEDRLPRDKAAFNHQVMCFGMALFHDALAAEKARGDTSFSEENPSIVQLINLFAKATSEQQARFDEQLKAEARVCYQYLRDLGRGKWPWVDFESRLLEPLAEVRENGYV